MSRMFPFITRTWNPVRYCSHNCVYCWAKKYGLDPRPRVHEDRLGAKFSPNDFLDLLTEVRLEAVAVGYDNYNHRLPEPPLHKTMELINELEKAGVRVFRKTLRPAHHEKEAPLR